MSIFKKKPKESPKSDGTGCGCPTPGGEVCTQKVEPKPEIRQAIGYMLGQAMYPTVEAARKAYILPKLETLCVSQGMCYTGNFSLNLAEKNFDKIQALFREEIPVIPLFKEEK